MPGPYNNILTEPDPLASLGGFNKRNKKSGRINPNIELEAEEVNRRNSAIVDIVNNINAGGTGGGIGISVTSFGAVADWDPDTQTGTDNRLAFQNAINKAIEDNVPLQVPSGKYLVICDDDGVTDNNLQVDPDPNGNNRLFIYGDGVDNTLIKMGPLTQAPVTQINLFDQHLDTILIIKDMTTEGPTTPLGTTSNSQSTVRSRGRGLLALDNVKAFDQRIPVDIAANQEHTDTTAAGSTTTVINLTTGGLTVDAHVGQTIAVGPDQRIVLSNTATSVTVDIPYLSAPSNGTQVIIGGVVDYFIKDCDLTAYDACTFVNQNAVGGFLTTTGTDYRTNDRFNIFNFQENHNIYLADNTGLECNNCRFLETTGSFSQGGFAIHMASSASNGIAPISTNISNCIFRDFETGILTNQFVPTTISNCDLQGVAGKSIHAIRVRNGGASIINTKITGSYTAGGLNAFTTGAGSMLATNVSFDISGGGTANRCVIMDDPLGAAWGFETCTFKCDGIRQIDFQNTGDLFFNNCEFLDTASNWLSIRGGNVDVRNSRFASTGTPINEFLGTTAAHVVNFVNCNFDTTVSPVRSLDPDFDVDIRGNNNINLNTAIVVSDTVAAGSTDTVVNLTTGGLSGGAHVGEILRIAISGVFEERIISANTASTVTVDTPFSAAPATSTSLIIKNQPAMFNFTNGSTGIITGNLQPLERINPAPVLSATTTKLPDMFSTHHVSGTTTIANLNLGVENPSTTADLGFVGPFRLIIDDAAGLTINSAGNIRPKGGSAVLAQDETFTAIFDNVLNVWYEI